MFSFFLLLLRMHGQQDLFAFDVLYDKINFPYLVALQFIDYITDCFKKTEDVCFWGCSILFFLFEKFHIYLWSTFLRQ
jgi:hypothetical protein